MTPLKKEYRRGQSATKRHAAWFAWSPLPRVDVQLIYLLRIASRQEYCAKRDRICSSTRHLEAEALRNYLGQDFPLIPSHPG